MSWWVTLLVSAELWYIKWILNDKWEAKDMSLPTLALGRLCMPISQPVDLLDQVYPSDIHQARCKNTSGVWYEWAWRTLVNLSEGLGLRALGAMTRLGPSPSVPWTRLQQQLHRWGDVGVMCVSTRFRQKYFMAKWAWAEMRLPPSPPHLHHSL